MLGAIVTAITILSGFITSENRPDQRVSANGSRARVVLITIDSLTASRMSLHGYFRDTTPLLERLGQEAFVFDRHYSNGNYTTPSIGSILTGTRPWVHRAFQLNSRPVAPIAQAGLIPTLKQAGYRTLAVATNPYAMPELHRIGSWIDREQVGKVEFADYKLLNQFPTFGSVLFFPTPRRIQYAYRRLAYPRHTGNSHFDPEDAFAAARDLLATELDDQDPELLWIHLFPPHDPYAAPAPFLRLFDPSDEALAVHDSVAPIAFAAKAYSNFPGALSGRYDEAVRYVDYHVGRFLDWLKEEGCYDDSLIIVTADHGESFAHSYGRHGGPMLYEDLIHVPLLIKLPHQQTGARITDVVTEHADLFPTILDCLGLPVPNHVGGRSLRPVMEGRKLDARPVYAMNFEQNRVSGPLENGTVALLDGRYKYVRYLGQIRYPYMPKLQDGLYDVVSDPAEKDDLSLTRPEISVRMRAAIDAAVSKYSLPADRR
jgi:arylsulfatase A-like enzyme